MGHMPLLEPTTSKDTSCACAPIRHSLWAEGTPRKFELLPKWVRCWSSVNHNTLQLKVRAYRKLWASTEHLLRAAILAGEFGKIHHINMITDISLVRMQNAHAGLN